MLSVILSASYEYNYYIIYLMNIIGCTRLLCVLFVYLYFVGFMFDISCFIFI